jgi:succinoglycan biosynthesis protein ExoO
MTSSLSYNHPYIADETVPLVSVIMPAYNTAQYIEQAIESALHQTIANIEVIVVDDASVDNTTAIVKGFTDSRVRLLELAENKGAPTARNRAFQEAKGQWIAVLDSDDWYAPNRLEEMLRAAQQCEADMVADDIWFIEDGSRAPWTTLVKESGQEVLAPQVVTDLFYLKDDIHGRQGLHLGLSKPLINRSFLIKHAIFYNPELTMGEEDFFFCLECLIRGAKFVFQPTPYYYYRARPGSLFTRSQLERLTQTCQAIQAWIDKDEIKANPSLQRALAYSLNAHQQSLAYYSVVEPLKQKPIDPVAIISALLQNPYFFVRITQRLPQIIGLRLKRIFDPGEATTGRRTA